MIYFVKANDRIKIGYAEDPSDRIASLQTSSPFPLEVMLIIDGNYDKENELHKKFRSRRVSGEWFQYVEEIKEYISDNLDQDRKYEFGFITEDFNGSEQILKLRKKHKLSLQAFGELLGITAQSAKEIQDREKTGGITIKVMQRVANALGYKFEYRFLPDGNKKEIIENNQPID